MRPKDQSTLRLEESAAEEGRKSVSAIRWLAAGTPARYTRLDRQQLRIGRGDEAEVQLESGGVSRLHAELNRQGSIYAVRDLGSTNGSYVNGQRVQHAALSEGDVVRFGDSVGVVLRIGADTRDDEADFVEIAPGAWMGPGLGVALAELRRVAPSTLPVVIVGETGTGKDCTARSIHQASGRGGAFHAVNCAALPVGLAEAELFGHRKGAFTGAEQATSGHLRAADKGTLFLDEFAELPPPVQAKLLRALQDGAVVPLGDTRAVHVDVRIVTACQVPLEDLVANNRVRADLAARLSGVTLVLPPLRERRVDVALFFELFLKQHSGGRAPALEPRLLEALLLQPWPGNVRELSLLAQKLIVLHGHESTLKLKALPEEWRARVATKPSEAAPFSGVADRREHDLSRLAEELKRHDGNLARASAAAGISRQRAYRLLKDRKPDELLNELSLLAAGEREP